MCTDEVDISMRLNHMIWSFQLCYAKELYQNYRYIFTKHTYDLDIYLDICFNDPTLLYVQFDRIYNNWIASIEDISPSTLEYHTVMAIVNRTFDNLSTSWKDQIKYFLINIILSN